MSRSRPIAGLVLGLLAALEARAETPRGPSVVVLPFQPAQSALSALLLQRVTDLVKGELRRAGRLVVVQPGAAAQPAAATPPPVASDAAARSVGDAERLYAQGRERVGKHEFEEAVQLLGSAVAKLERSLSALTDYGLLADVHLWHGIAYFRAGKEALGRAAIERALVLRPDLQLDPRRYPPLFRRIVEEVRAKVRGAARGTLLVVTTPPGCEVLLDGVLRGRTPVELADVPAGRHYVRVSCAGCEPAAVVRDVPAGGRAEVRTALVASRIQAPPSAPDPVPLLLRRLRRGLVDARAIAHAGEVALRSLADHVIFGYFAKGSGSFHLTAYVYRAQDGRLVPLPVARFDPELLNAAEEARRISTAVEKTMLTLPPAVAQVRRGTGAREIRSAGDLARVEERMAREELERLAREERERQLASLGQFDLPRGERAVEPPFYRRWWFWALVGAAVAGGTAGAVVGATSGAGTASVGIRWTRR